MYNSKNNVIVGSNSSANAGRISAALKDKIDHTVVESWEALEQQLADSTQALLITDLNLNDCFPSVVFENILEISDRISVIVLLEDTNTHMLYRTRAYDLWEVLPINAVDDDRFYFLVSSAQLKFEFWAQFS